MQAPKLRAYLVACAMIFAAPLQAAADPIQDLSMDNYKAGWFPNYYRGSGPLTCPRACRAWTGAPAEGENANELVETAKRAHVCKVTNRPEIVQKPLNEPASHWIYGTQYDDLPVCYATMKFGGPWLSREFMCLCVEDCRKPDLTVSTIHRPVWNGTQSVISVDIANLGATAAGPSVAELSDYQSGASTSVAVPAIAAGATVTVAFTLPYWVYDPDASLIVTLDVKNDVDECDEDNNDRSFFERG
jgi:hypothetical protein